jgi:uncharacterized membrane protein
LRYIPVLSGKFLFNAVSLWGYAAILFTFFGVNFYLVGLHSYAQGEGLGAIPNWLFYTIVIFYAFTEFSAAKNWVMTTDVKFTFAQFFKSLSIKITTVLAVYFCIILFYFFSEINTQDFLTYITNFSWILLKVCLLVVIVNLLIIPIKLYPIYSEEISNLKIKSEESLAGNWSFSILIIFTTILIAFTLTILMLPLSLWINNILADFSGKYFITLIINIVFVIVAAPISFGLSKYFLQLVRKEDVKVSSLFYGYKRFGTIILANIMLFTFTIFWSIFLIVPGVIAGLTYSMTFLIILDNPSISVFEAANRSKRLMQGNKLKLFLLMLSLYGWFILSLITLGFGFLWFIPYFHVVIINFYEELKIKQNENVNIYNINKDIEQ